MGISSHKIPQGAHGLCTQVPTFADMVIHHLANSPGLCLPICPVDVVHHATEHGHVGHLSADEACLHLLAAHKFAHLFFKHPLHLVDEFGTLIIVDVRFVEGLEFPVFRVSEGGIHD